MRTENVYFGCGHENPATTQEKKAEVRSMRVARPPDNNTAMHQGSAPLVAVAN